MVDFRIYPDFTEAEFLCKCQKCGLAEMAPDFMAQLQALRTTYGRPMPVSSGYRCPDHNDRVSHTGRTGPHTTGRAVDIAVAGRDAYDLLKLALLHGFTGIGINQKGGARFLHLDTLTGPDSAPRPRVWSY